MEWVVIALATLIGPIAAVQISQWLDRNRQARAEKVAVFRTLMATRATTLAPSHVEALNTIDIVFGSSSIQDRNVRNDWKAYLDHLNNKDYPRENWNARRVELFVDLLSTMASNLGFEFDKTHIKNQAYFPTGYAELETEQTVMRKAIVEVLLGRRALPMHVTNIPAPGVPAPLPPEQAAAPEQLAAPQQPPGAARQ